MSTVLVTGSAGFIGYHAAKRMLEGGHRVIGVDNMCPYYDPQLKEGRTAILRNHENFIEIRASIEEPGLLAELFSKYKPEIVLHFAAQAGVRYSIEEPRQYVTSNFDGTFELLEAARHVPPKHMLLASTSSAYGANTKMPYKETDRADHQMSFYAATKKATEAIAHSYSHLYDLPITAFRFFTVYGPWGRPDMALFKFTKAMLAGDSIDIYNHGNMSRDFTYIDDLIEAIVRLTELAPAKGKPQADDSLSPVAPFRVVNIGAGNPIKLTDFVDALESAMGITAKKNLMEMQPGDVAKTWADTSLLTELVGPISQTSIDVGIQNFVGWYKGDYLEMLDGVTSSS